MTLKILTRPGVRSYRMSDLLRQEKSGLSHLLIEELRPEIQKSVYAHTVPVTSRPAKPGLSSELIHFLIN